MSVKASISVRSCPTSSPLVILPRRRPHHDEVSAVEKNLPGKFSGQVLGSEVPAVDEVLSAVREGAFLPPRLSFAPPQLLHILLYYLHDDELRGNQANLFEEG